MTKLFGLDVIVSPLVTPIAKLRLSPDFKACSPHVIASMNQWLLDTFGTKEVFYMMGGKCVVSPEMYRRIRVECPEPYEQIAKVTL